MQEPVVHLGVSGAAITEMGWGGEGGRSAGVDGLLWGTVDGGDRMADWGRPQEGWWTVTIRPLAVMPTDQQKERPRTPSSILSLVPSVATVTHRQHEKHL